MNMPSGVDVPVVIHTPRGMDALWPLVKNTCIVIIVRCNCYSSLRCGTVYFLAELEQFLRYAVKYRLWR